MTDRYHPGPRSHQDQYLRQALRGYAGTIAANHPRPPASLVWFRAERRRRLLAIRAAERPLRIMQALAILCAALAATWFAGFSSWLHRPPSLEAALGPALLPLAIATAVLVAGGCWIMLAASRRPLSSPGQQPPRSATR